MNRNYILGIKFNKTYRDYLGALRQDNEHAADIGAEQMSKLLADYGGMSFIGDNEYIKVDDKIGTWDLTSNRPVEYRIARRYKTILDRQFGDMIEVDIYKLAKDINDKMRRYRLSKKTLTKLQENNKKENTYVGVILTKEFWDSYKDSNIEPYLIEEEFINYTEDNDIYLGLHQVDNYTPNSLKKVDLVSVPLTTAEAYEGLIQLKKLAGDHIKLKFQEINN